MSQKITKCKKCGSEDLFSRGYCEPCYREYRKDRYRNKAAFTGEYPETKTCPRCGATKSSDEFARNTKRADGLEPYCKECRRTEIAARRSSDKMKYFCQRKMHDCTKNGIAFNLTVDYLEQLWTGVCPVTGKTLTFGGREGAQLDRVDPNKGYVIGNVHFIYSRMNRLKSDASIDDLEKLLAYMRANQ